MGTKINRNPLSINETQEASLCAQLSTFMYTDIQKEEFDGQTIGSILNSPTFKTEANENFIPIIDLISSYTLRTMKIIGQSTIDNKSCEHNEKTFTSFGENLITATAFMSEKGDIYIAYRGTGDGKWLDNAVGLAEEKSVMQEAAARYFDYIIDKYRDYIEQTGCNIYVTGHSKGGNEAQYVCMNANNSGLVKKCYSFDGQGFSPEAINCFKERYGLNNYDRQRNKIIGINGNNDFVSPLGESIVRPDRLYYIKTREYKDFLFHTRDALLGKHEIENMFGPGDGNELLWAKASPGHLNFSYNADGEVISSKRGAFSEWTETFWKHSLTLSRSERKSFAETLMQVFEDIGPGEYKQGTGDVKRVSLLQVAEGLPGGITAFIGATGEFVLKKIKSIANSLLDKVERTRSYPHFAAGLMLHGIAALADAAAEGLNLAVKNLYPAVISKIVAIKSKIFPERKESIDALDTSLQKLLVQEKLQRDLGIETPENKELRTGTRTRIYKNDEISYQYAVSRTDAPVLTTVIGQTEDIAKQYAVLKAEGSKLIDFSDTYASLSYMAADPTLTEYDRYRKALAVTARRVGEEIRKGNDVLMVVPGMMDSVQRKNLNRMIKEEVENRAKFISCARIVSAADKENPYSGIAFTESTRSMDQSDEYNFILRDEVTPIAQMSQTDILEYRTKELLTTDIDRLDLSESTVKLIEQRKIEIMQEIEDIRQLTKESEQIIDTLPEEDLKVVLEDMEETDREQEESDMDLTG